MNKTIAYLVWCVACVSAGLCQSNGYLIATSAGSSNPYFYTGIGDGNPATSAALGRRTLDVTADGSGNVYVAAGRLIRKITPDGKISTIAGAGTSVGDFVPATDAALWPTAIVADGAGNLFIADTAFGIFRIRMIDTKGIITTIAGGAPCCNLGDGGPAISAYIGIPYGLAIDSSGSVYVAQADAQNNNVIRKISGRTITTVAGSGPGPGDGVLATKVSLSRPLGVAVDKANNIYIAEASGNRVRMVSPNGMISTVAGNGNASTSGDGGSAAQAGINSPYHVAVDAAGDIFISQINDARIRMVSPGGTISTIAGNGNNGSSGDGGPGPGASLDRPAGIAVGSCSQLYIAEDSSSIPAVRVLNPTPAITPGGVVPAGSSATTIESGSWLSIYGTNLAGCTGTWKGDFPLSLNGTSVTLDSKPGYLWFVSPTQINVQMPDDTTNGPINVTVKTAGGTASSTVTLAQYAPAFSLLNSKYPAAIVVTPTGYDIVGPSGALPYATRPVKAGETVTLFGGGFGPTNPPVFSGKLFSGAAQCVMTPQVTIGGVSATVTFAGITGAGLYQLNVIVPAAGSGDQPLQASVGGVMAQPNIFLTLQ